MPPTERNQYADWDVECEAGLIQDRFLRLLIESTVTESIIGRMRILNAYYLPEGGDALLYDAMTPVKRPKNSSEMRYPTHSMAVQYTVK